MAKKHDIVIALQGGGAHGAFAWGVLDRILEEKDFNIKGISGTSAGGMNAASVIQGLLKGGAKIAKETLNAYWQKISELSATMRFEEYNQNEDVSFLNDKKKIFNLENSINQFFITPLIEHFSPYQLNPLNQNPLEDFINDFFDFELFKRNQEHRIFLGATHVKTGKIKVFSNADMSSSVLMASACLPHFFQSVEVDGEYYWDGGFIANPAIYPLMDLDAQDIMIVQLTKTHAQEIPKTKEDITERLKEITYNGCLVREMRAIYFISKLIDNGMIKDNALTRFNMHLIKDEDAFKNLTLKSALNPNWEFITALKQKGRIAAENWMEEYLFKTPEQRRIDSLKSFEDFIS